jgi:hypothetical protein
MGSPLAARTVDGEDANTVVAITTYANGEFVVIMLSFIFLIASDFVRRLDDQNGKAGRLLALTQQQNPSRSYPRKVFLAVLKIARFPRWPDRARIRKTSRWKCEIAVH